MKIRRVIIQGRQFRKLDIDLTYPANHPKAGQPLEKVCFIGENGTGKSTLLELLARVAANPMTNLPGDLAILVEFEWDRHRLVKIHNIKQYFDKNIILDSEKVTEETLSRFLNARKEQSQEVIETVSRSRFDNQLEMYKKFQDFVQNINSDRLVLYSPAESQQNQFLISDVVNLTTLDNSLKLIKDFPYYHVISTSELKQFWELLIYVIFKREEDRVKFESQPENIDKTKRTLIEEFNANYPDILKILADEWSVILDHIGLYFDYETAKRPIQLSDQLEVYIKTRSNNDQLPYKALSSGIRHLILRIGYITVLFFKREIRSALAFIDEPENSLFPSLQYKIVSIYERIAPKAQLFFATHSPIIAAQFEPCERIILKHNEIEKTVIVSKGTSPTGDDPNDLLFKDFGLDTLLGEKGLEKLQRYIELKSLIKSEENGEQKEKLIHEYLSIGQEYNF